jgi:hypothetical protein
VRFESKWIKCAAILFFMSACAVRSVYVPVSLPVPLFDSTKRVQATGYLGTNTIQLQLATNPFKRSLFGINTNYGAGLAIYEGFAGLYNYSKTARWRYELLGGGGYTNNYAQVDRAWFDAFSHEKSSFETLSAYNKIFLQPSVGFFSSIRIYKLNFSFSLSGRVSYLHFQKYIYREINANNLSVNGPPSYILNREYYNKDLFLLEPAFTNKVGRNNFYVVLQLLGVVPYSTQIDIRYTKFSPVILFSTGIQYNMRLKKTKKAA